MGDHRLPGQVTPQQGQPQPGTGTQPPGQGAPLPGPGAPSPQPGAASQPPPAPLPQQPAPGYQQGYQQDGRPGQFGAEGTIEFTLQGSVMTSNMLTPKVFIDGYPVPASYGFNRLPVPPGRHTVSAEATWIVKYGQASYEVDVPPGQSVPVFYAAPMVQFLKGRMGPVKQKRAGGWIFIVLLVVIVLVVVLAIVAGS